MKVNTGAGPSRTRPTPLEEEQAELTRLHQVLPKLLCDNGGAVECESLIRGLVVREYALIDLSLTALLFGCYFGVTQRRLATTVSSGRFLSFYELAESVPLVRKLKLVGSVLDVPAGVSGTIQRINDARNAIAHVGVAGLSSRREFRYGGERLFTEVGIRRFLWDVRHTHEHLTKMASELGKGTARFGKRKHNPAWYEILFAQAPSVLSCALLAEKPGKLTKHEE